MSATTASTKHFRCAFCGESQTWGQCTSRDGQLLFCRTCDAALAALHCRGGENCTEHLFADALQIWETADAAK